MSKLKSPSPPRRPAMAELSHLDTLDLHGRGIDDAFLSDIATRVDAKMLSLEATAVSAAGMQELTRFPRLHWLLIEDSRVDDASVPALEKLTGLAHLIVRGSSLTEKATKRLQTALPRTKVVVE